MNKDLAKRYTVIERDIDLNSLRKEKAKLERQLAEDEPSKEEITEFVEAEHPYYELDSTEINKRLQEIEGILN